jgi:transcriptional regulator with XRE-family HTH domain
MMARKSVSCYRHPDCESPRRSNAAQITEIRKPCQEVFDNKLKPAVRQSFGERLRQAFEGIGNSEIARKIGVSPSAITDYMKGKTLPTAEGLVRIAEISKTNLHWLLTGEGEESNDPLRFLDERRRVTVIAVASKLGITPEALIADLVDEALRERAADMVKNMSELDGSEMDQLFAILKLRDVSEPGAVGRVRSPTVREGTK